jgi:hypothetical protein
MLLDICAAFVEERQCLQRESVALIPPAELPSLFRQPDYSVNGRAT